jgi:hypothetical protein
VNASFLVAIDDFSFDASAFISAHLTHLAPRFQRAIFDDNHGTTI